MPQAGRVVHPRHAVEFADEEVPLGIQTDAVWPMDVVPHGDEPAVGIEYLDAMGLAIGDVDAIVFVDDDVMRTDELARVDARFAPRQDMPAIGGEFVDADITVAVGDVQVCGDTRHRHVGGAVKGFALPFGCRLVGTAQGHQMLAFRGEFLNGVQAIIHAIDGIVGADMDAVRPLAEQLLTERPQEVTVAVEDADRVLTPIEDIHVVLGVHRDASYIDEGPTRRQLLPILNGLKEQVSTAKCNRHNAPPSFSVSHEGCLPLPRSGYYPLRMPALSIIGSPL